MDVIEGKVFIVDDDESVRKSISILLKIAGYQVATFASAESLLTIDEYWQPGCIVLDIFLEGRTGLELQAEIQRRFKHLPIIYITGQGDVPMTVRALKNGAVNFLQKPIDDSILLATIDEALKLSKSIMLEQDEIRSCKLLMTSLTPRETEIFRMVIKGLLNKQIAAELNIAEHTVKLHRGKITEKLGIKSVAEMVHIAAKLGLI